MPAESIGYDPVALDAVRCERSFARFVRAAWDLAAPEPFSPGRHVAAIVAHLQAVARGELRRLLVTVPPRHGKSTLVSVLWPAWLWTWRPGARIIGASYRQELAERDAVAARRVIESPWYRARWGERIGADQNRQARYATAEGGHRVTTSVGGGATGEGADVFVIDDPHDLTEVHSAASRRAVLAWWQSVARHRLNDPRTGAFVVVMQRGHEDDLAAHLLAESGWTHVCLPEEFEAERRCVTAWWSDTRTTPGELLWPERRGPSEVEESKRAGSYIYASQFQQRPAPEGGGLFKRAWFRYWRPGPDEGAQLLDGSGSSRYVDLARAPRFVTVDLAVSLKTSADYTVMQAWAAAGQELILLDQVRARIEGPDLLPTLRAVLARNKATVAWVERVGFQLSLIQQARRENVPVRELEADRDKIARALPATAMFEAGRIWFPESAQWMGDLEDELLHFPTGAHDDQADAVAYACRVAQGLMGGPPEPPVVPDRATAGSAFRNAEVPAAPRGWEDDVPTPILDSRPASLRWS